MPRVCSKLVTLLLLLSVASPTLAAPKKKKSEDSAEESESERKGSTGSASAKKKKSEAKDDAEGDAEKGEEKSLEDKMSEAAEAKTDKPAEPEAAPEAAPEEVSGQPDSWERPPEDEEKPKKEVAAVAEEKVGDGKPWMVGLVAGWGFKTASQTEGLGADPYGLTAGLRGGYTLDFNLHVGLFVQYYLGSTQSGRQARVVLGTQETTASALEFGAQVGYDFWIGPLILRPSLQLGMSMAFTDVTGVNTTVTDALAAPGLELLVPLDGWYLGGDFRPVFIIGDAPGVLLIGAHGGLRFE